MTADSPLARHHSTFGAKFPAQMKAGCLMSLFTNLLRMDALAQSYGCGLHPKLRAAIEADTRWPSKAASPAHFEGAPLPEEVTRLPLSAHQSGQKRA